MLKPYSENSGVIAQIFLAKLIRLFVHLSVECSNNPSQGPLPTQLNSVALVRERTIPTERPPPVGEVSANFCGWRGVAWSAQRVPTAVKLCFLDLEPLLFLFK